MTSVFFPVNLEKVPLNNFSKVHVNVGKQISLWTQKVPVNILKKKVSVNLWKLPVNT